MGYAQEGVERKRLAAALRRVHDDLENPANPGYNSTQRSQMQEDSERASTALENGVTMADPTMRRGSFIVDIKRKSELSYPGEQFARYDDAGLVAEAMVRLGADAVLVNVDVSHFESCLRFHTRKLLLTAVTTSSTALTVATSGNSSKCVVRAPPSFVLSFQTALALARWVIPAVSFVCAVFGDALSNVLDKIQKSKQLFKVWSLVDGR